MSKGDDRASAGSSSLNESMGRAVFGRDWDKMRERTDRLSRESERHLRRIRQASTVTNLAISACVVALAIAALGGAAIVVDAALQYIGAI